MEYRREIDGLRALALIPVIFFHAGFQEFSGGYIGVDVFFVISGYLITSVIIDEKHTGRFTLIRFYERRARRILPALFLVMGSCLPFAWEWLYPPEMKTFSQSLLAASGFFSNILFFRSSGYFDSSAELNPLLHTWSLAVEGQYYLLFPLILALAWKSGKQTIIFFLVVLSVTSLATGLWLEKSMPAAAFYLLPSRAWELLMGSLIALFSIEKVKLTQDQLINQFGSLIGLILLCYAICSFDKSSPFQSVLLPTFGAAFIIIFATDKTLVGALLGNRILVGIGLISYSAYLWHQPLFAFARNIGPDTPTKFEFLILTVLTLILAYFTWKYVEIPFRVQRFHRKTILLFAIAGSAFFAIIGLTGHRSKGFENRFTEQRDFISHFENSIPEWKYFTNEQILVKYRSDCDFYDLTAYRHGFPTNKPVAGISKDCFIRDPKRNSVVFIWGDSHAQQLYPGLKQILPESWQIMQVASSGCVAKLNADANNDNYCEYSNWFAYSAIVKNKPDVLIIGQNAHQNLRNMYEIGAAMLKIGVKKVIFTGPTPHWVSNLPQLVVQQLWNETPRRTFVGINVEMINLDRKLKLNFKPSSSIQYVSLIDYFCNDSGCLVYIGDDIKSGITTWDYGHLTPIASYQFAKDVLFDVVTSNGSYIDK